MYLLDFLGLAKKKVVKSGILRDKTMDDKLIYIPYNDKQNYPFW